MTTATRLFVGNLPENTQESDLQSAFSSFGQITTLDLKSKPAPEENKKFAFISLAASNIGIESCIKHFSNESFNGNILYVTRARESFLERLQREREQAQQKETEKNTPIEHVQLQENPVLNLGTKLNPRKQNSLDLDRRNRKQNNLDIDHQNRKQIASNGYKEMKIRNSDTKTSLSSLEVVYDKIQPESLEQDSKKYEAEKKRLESMKQKRQEFNKKRSIIKTGLTGVDKVPNKKLKFFDDDDLPQPVESSIEQANAKKSTLFDDDNDSGDEVNFDVKKQFEGVKGQKVLDLQSRYKSDKRFTLDERFIDDAEEETTEATDEIVELGTEDEKAKQLNILQDVLGVTLRQKAPDADNKKIKPRLGMVRFDPLQQDHIKFLAPVEPKPEPTKKSKKKGKEKLEEINAEPPKPEGPKVEVSKEQFYKVSDTLKEAIAQPTTFSLLSLFGKKEDEDNAHQKQDEEYIPLDAPKTKEKKVKNPLDPTERNPFKYDSSDSEDEPENEVAKVEAPVTEVKAVWKEKLFFTEFDTRLKEGLLFFNKIPETEVQKERRELKSLMKKRIYNKDRKNQMFKKKIGGKRKSMKKPYKSKH